MEWREIEGFEGLYSVSDTGLVMSHGNGLRKTREKILSGRVGGKRQYPNVQLKREGIPTYEYVHRIVAKAFIPNPDNLPEVNHKDYDKSNNCVSNLEWCSPQRNTEHSHAKSYVLKDGENLIKVFNLRKYCRENNLDRNKVKKLIVHTDN